MFDSEFSLSVLLFILFNKVSTRRKKKPAAVSSFSTIIEREKQLIDLIFYSKKTFVFRKFVLDYLIRGQASRTRVRLVFFVDF